MGAFVLTSENYYSQEANKEYLSVSQYKQFVGTYGRRGCEFTALEELNGRWQQKKNSGMMIGSYVDSYVEGTLDEFKKNNPEIFKKDGTLKADFTKAEQVPAVKSSDEFAKEKTLPVKKTRRVTIINVISCEFSILD